MKRQRYPTDLVDEEWLKIEEFFKVSHRVDHYYIAEEKSWMRFLRFKNRM